MRSPASMSLPEIKTLPLLLLLALYIVLILQEPSTTDVLNENVSRSTAVTSTRTTAQCAIGVMPHAWTPHNAKNSHILTVNQDCPASSDLLLKQSEPTASKTKVISFFLIYYNAVHLLAHHIDSWLQYSAEMKAKIQFLIVDDGSAPNFRAVDFLKANRHLLDSLDILVYQIDQDLVWNIGGARNLGFWLAPTEWVFMLDMDTLVRNTTMDYIIDLVEEEKSGAPEEISTIYKNFYRLGSLRKAHPAVILSTKESYWKAGGCDEDFVGNYGMTDPHFHYRVSKTDSLRPKSVTESMMSRSIFLEHMKDDVTCPKGLTCLPSYHGDKPPKNPEKNRNVFEEKQNGKRAWSNEYLRFTWKHVW